MEESLQKQPTAGSDAPSAAPAPLPWQRQPRTHLVLITAAIMCLVGIYAALSSTERSSINLEDAIRRTRAVCGDIEAPTSAPTSAKANYVLVPPTRPPPINIHLHLVLCSADDTDATDGLIDDAMVSTLYDALATIRGLLNLAASDGGGRGRVNMVEEVPVLSMTLSKSPLRVCKASTRAADNVNDDEEMTTEEAASVGSLIVGATTQSWVVMTTVRRTVLRSVGTAASSSSSCQRDHNRRMWCELLMPHTSGESRSATNVTQASDDKAKVRTWVGGVVASILGVQSFRDVVGIRAYLTSRRFAACHYVVSALSGLAQILEAAPTMPLAVALGKAIDQAVDSITYRHGTATSTDTVSTRTVRAAEVIEQCTMDPTLLPQMFYPLEHLMAVHLSFLLPVIVAFLAGLSLSLKEWKRQRKVQRAAQETVALSTAS
jgi:hypothetical protein